MEISIRDLNVRRVDSKGTLYSNLTLGLPDHKVTGMFGANGIGKSTLLRVIAGLTNGLTSNGRAAITQSKPKGYISYAPQNYSASLMPWMSVLDNIALPLAAEHRHPNGDYRLACQSLIKQFDVGFADVPAFRLSGGQQQTTVLLRAISRCPDFLLLDEPFSALDIYGGATFRDHYFKHIRSKQIATLFVTHDKEELTRYSDRVVFLRPQSGTTIADVYDLDRPAEQNQLKILLDGGMADAGPIEQTA